MTGPTKPSRRLLGLPTRTWIFTALVAGILTGVAVHFSDWRDLRDLAGRVSPSWLGAAMALQLLVFVLRAGAWRAVVHRGEQRVSFAALLRLNLAKHFADQAVPAGGVTGSILVVHGLQRRGVERRMAMSAFVVQTVGNSAALIVAVSASLVLLAWLRPVPAWVWLAGGAFVAVSAAIPLVVVLLARGTSMPLPKLVRRQRAVQALVGAMSAADNQLIGSVPLLVRALVLNVAVTAVDAAVLWLLLGSLGIRFGPAEVYVAQSLVMLARNASFLPSAMGSFDAVSVAVLSLLGLGFAAAVAATLLYRGVNLWFPILPGSIAAQRELA